jgi:squalene monooxygenase
VQNSPKLDPLVQNNSISISIPLFMSEDPDVIIVGAGIIGCSLAVALSKQGRNVVLFERDWSEPDRIVGELLQPGGVRALVELGLRDCLEGIDAIPEYGYQVIYRDEKVIIPYLGRDECSREGRSFHHGRFINNLRKAAKKCARYCSQWMI